MTLSPDSSSFSFTLSAALEALPFFSVLLLSASHSSIQQQLRSCSDCFCAVSFATCGLSRFVSSSSAVRASVMR